MKKLKEVRYIIIHHTGRNNDFPFFIKLRHVFLRGWEDIGYHFLIGNTRPFTIDGKLYQGRDEAFEGAHALGYNQCSIGVCLIGNFNKKKPSKNQMETLYTFLVEKIKKHGLSLESIKGHKELLNTRKKCPGKNIDMDEIRKEVAFRLSQEDKAA